MALTRTTNHKLEVAKKEKSKREEIIEKQKIKTMAAKCYRNKGGINLSSRNDENYKSDIRDNIDLDQANNKYLF